MLKTFEVSFCDAEAEKTASERMLSEKVDNKADFEMYSNPLIKFVWFSLINEKT